MRRRIVMVAVASAVLAVVVFALPLAFAVRHLYLVDERGELERAALRVAVSVGTDFAGRDPAELSIGEAGSQLALYNKSGTRVGGLGPAVADSATRTALAGGLGQSQDSGWLVVAVPVASGENVVGAVRSAEPSATVVRRTLLTWGAMLIAAAIAIALAAIAAIVLARRVGRPLDELAQASQALGEGDFAVRTEPTGMSEIDRAGAALNVTAARLGDLVAREQQIASNASHQLRTPLAGLRATLEAALVDPSGDLPVAARSAIAAADRLEVTIDDLILLTRGAAAPLMDQDVEVLVDAAAARWHGPFAERGRRLQVHVPTGLPRVAATSFAVDHVLEVLLDNAYRHGAGTVTISVRGADVAVAIDVGDEGNGIDESRDVFARGVSTDGGAGIGLALARSLAEDQGGRLQLSRRTPSAQFTLLLPAA